MKIMETVVNCQVITNVSVFLILLWGTGEDTDNV